MTEGKLRITIIAAAFALAAAMTPAHTAAEIVALPVEQRAVTIGFNRYKPTILGFEKTEMPSVRIKSAWAVPGQQTN